ncbi:MAG: hypothetical protein ABSH05_22720 [Bryobacteraceae bacterium]|jgi:hypothetical protein
MRLRLILTLGVAVAVAALNSLIPRGLAAWLLQVAVVWSARSWATRREILTVAAGCSLCVFVGLWLSPESLVPPWIPLTNRALGIGAIWALAYAHVMQRTAEAAHEKASAELEESRSQVRVLSGLLPICASCKRIRNEAGVWEQLEVYIRNRSEASFTHGLCAECLAQLYPEFASRLKDG